MCVQSVCKRVSFQRLSLRPAVVSLLRLTTVYVPYRFDEVYSLPPFIIPLACAVRLMVHRPTCRRIRLLQVDRLA